MGRGVPSFSETVRRRRNNILTRKHRYDTWENREWFDALFGRRYLTAPGSYSNFRSVQRYTLLEVLRDSLLDFDLPSAVHAVVAISATGGQLQAHVAHRAKDTDVSSITLRTENEGLLAGLELLLIAKGGAKRTDGTQQANVSLTQAVLHYRTLEYNSIRPLIDGVQLQHERAAFLLVLAKDPLRALAELADHPPPRFLSFPSNWGTHAHYRPFRDVFRGLLHHSLWATAVEPAKARKRKRESADTLALRDKGGTQEGHVDAASHRSPLFASATALHHPAEASDHKREALKNLQRAQQHFEGDPLLACCTAQLLLADGQPVAAHECLEALISQRPRDSDSYTLKAIFVQSNPASTAHAERKATVAGPAAAAAGSVEDAEVEELRQLGQLYLSALRLDPSNDFALRQVAQLNARDVVPADAFAGVLAEHLDICPASGQAWRSLAELLPTICHDQDQMEVLWSDRRPWWRRAHFSPLSGGQRCAELARQLQSSEGMCRAVLHKGICALYILGREAVSLVDAIQAALASAHRDELAAELAQISERVLSN
ncbi:hypothetical protein CYMTET_19033 [Cymbomonas tetramitiformis]|uniref:Uncharacterized protein n=1 Tax=Cymbomonas tetramitiformis TaxID=36881 RepID=A0AAE0G6T2_9CHLO|nr:hypothetical protein CYMTET_19033 [Cymbomonas tetramitiformis]